MINIGLLKKLTFIADVTQQLEPFQFNGLEIAINTLLDGSEQIQYGFNVLNIPYSTYTPEKVTAGSPAEINVTFGAETGLNVIYLITYVLREIYNERLDIYINYATKPEGQELKVFCGTYITKDKGFTNISAPISANDILRLNILKMDWAEFSGLFPNRNYSEDGRCKYTEESDDDYDYGNYNDYGSSYEKYGGYNGWSDDVIDDAFEGDPMNTWNVD